MQGQRRGCTGELESLEGLRLSCVAESLLMLFVKAAKAAERPDTQRIAQYEAELLKALDEYEAMLVLPFFSL